MRTRWWVVITVVGAIGLLAIGIVFPKLAGPVNTAVLTATFVAIFWYAIETRRDRSRPLKSDDILGSKQQT